MNHSPVNSDSDSEHKCDCVNLAFSLRKLGEGKWGRTKYRRIPESKGYWKGRIPKRALPGKTLLNKGFGAPIF